MAPLGWLLILVAGIGLILASWLLYGNSADAMWAGYRDGIIGTTVVLCAMALSLASPHVTLIGKHLEKIAIAETLGVEGVLLANIDAAMHRSFDVVVEASGSESKKARLWISSTDRCGNCSSVRARYSAWTRLPGTSTGRSRRERPPRT